MGGDLMKGREDGERVGVAVGAGWVEQSLSRMSRLKRGCAVGGPLPDQD